MSLPAKQTHITADSACARCWTLLYLAGVDHKIETLVAAPAAVEEALASLIVDNQDRYHALQYRALVTYIKRVYHPFLMCEPQVRSLVGCCSATSAIPGPCRHPCREWPTA